MVDKVAAFSRRLKWRTTCTLSLFLQEIFCSCIQADQAIMVAFSPAIDQNEAVTSGIVWLEIGESTHDVT